MSENFFSIVMVGYNSKEWINRAVESVLAQNYKNFEIVAVDALTDDGTYEALQEYEHLDNFKLFRSPKRSFQVENTLFGVKNSKPNSIVVTLDFDDWLPDADTLTRVCVPMDPPDGAAVLLSCWSARRRNGATGGATVTSVG